MKPSTIKKVVAQLANITKLLEQEVSNEFLTPIPSAPKTLQTISRSAFNKLPVLKRRVLIAEDVLDQLAMKKITPKRGVLIEVANVDKPDQEDFHGVKYNESVKCTLDNAKSCHVCAKGAVITALTKKFNHAKGTDLEEIYQGWYSEKDELDTHLIFGEDLWSEIEAQFEGDASYRTEAMEELLGCNDPVPKSLKSLMENIIKNGGKLKVGKHLIG